MLNKLIKKRFCDTHKHLIFEYRIHRVSILNFTTHYFYIRVSEIKTGGQKRIAPFLRRSLPIRELVAFPRSLAPVARLPSAFFFFFLPYQYLYVSLKVIAFLFLGNFILVYILNINYDFKTR